MKTFTNSQKLINEKDVKLFFTLCWLTYFCTYLGRLNFTASIAEIISTGFTKAQMGLVGSAFFLFYGMFQLVFGFLGDKYSPKLIVFFGVLTSGFVNLAMAFTHSANAMAVLWAFNGVAQSAVWSPMLCLTVERLQRKQALNASINYATTVPFGTFSAYLLSAAAIAISGWRLSFLISAVVLICTATAWILGMTHLEKAETIEETQEQAAEKQNPQKPHIEKIVIVIIAAVCLAALISGILKDGIQTWMPSFLSDNYGVASVMSIVLTLVIPIVNLGGVYLGKWLNNKFFHNELATSACAFAVAGGIFMLLLCTASLGSLWFSLFLFALCAALMLAINTMIVTLVPLRLQRLRRVSSLSGILNSATYLGSTISSYGVGLLLENGGWDATIFAWCVAALLGAIICALLIISWKKQR
ncbi:MAG: MFS transporter [Oscillospiraceae bacterium]